MRRVKRKYRRALWNWLNSDNGCAVWITYRDEQGVVRQTPELFNDAWSDYREVELKGHRLVVHVRRTWEHVGSELMGVKTVSEDHPLSQLRGRILRIRLDRVIRLVMADQDYHCYGGPTGVLERKRGGFTYYEEGEW